MQRQRPPTLLVMGLGCCAFAVLYLLWLLLYRRADLAALLAATFGNSDVLPALQARGLGRASTVRLAVTHLLVELVLTGLLVWSGFGLLLVWRSARWSAVATAGFSIAAALGHTFGLFSLTPPAEAIKVTPLLMDAVAVLFAIVLLGTMFLPDVSEAYAGELEIGPQSSVVLPEQRPAGR